MSVRSIAMAAVSAVAKIRVKDSARAELRISACRCVRRGEATWALVRTFMQSSKNQRYDNANRESFLFTCAGCQQATR